MHTDIHTYNTTYTNSDNVYASLPLLKSKRADYTLMKMQSRLNLSADMVNEVTDLMASASNGLNANNKVNCLSCMEG